MIYYLVSSSRYVEFGEGPISCWNVYECNGNAVGLMNQAGESDLEVFELIQVGEILEINRQVTKGDRAYDAFALYASHCSKPEYRQQNIKRELEELKQAIECTTYEDAQFSDIVSRALKFATVTNTDIADHCETMKISPRWWAQGTSLPMKSVRKHTCKFLLEIVNKDLAKYE